jgi:hypothetical protein
MVIKYLPAAVVSMERSDPQHHLVGWARSVVSWKVQ